MAISELHATKYRSPSEISLLIELLIENYFDDLKTKVGTKELAIIDKLLSLPIDISPQLMKIFEAPLNTLHFRDITNQLISHLIEAHIEKAKDNCVLTDDEEVLMNIVLTNAE